MELIVNQTDFGNTLPNGTYEAEFIGAETNEVQTKYGTKTRTKLSFRILTEPFNGNIVSRFFYWSNVNGVPTITKKSALGKAIKEISGEFKLTDAHIGRKVLIKVEQKEIDGKTYSNISNIIMHPENSKISSNNTIQTNTTLNNKPVVNNDTQTKNTTNISDEFNLDDLDI